MRKGHVPEQGIRLRAREASRPGTSLASNLFSLFCFLLPIVSLLLSFSSLLGRTYYKPTLSDNFYKRSPTFITFVFNIFLTYKELTACSSMIDVLISSKLSLTKHIIFIQ